MKAIPFIWSILLVGTPASHGQLNCPNTLLGADISSGTSYTESSVGMVYLNLDSPAKCLGTVSSLRYCHYPTQADVLYRTRVGIYRLVGSNYEPVTGSDQLLTVDTTESMGFTCSSVDLTVQIEPGDVVGACVALIQQGGGQPFLRLVGENAADFNVSGTMSVLSGMNRCNLGMLPSVPMDSLMPFSSTILHLSATIMPSAAPTTMASMTTIETMPGTMATTGANENTNTTMESPAPGDGDGNIAGTAVGVVFALLLVIVITVVIIVVVIVVLRSKQGKATFSTGTGFFGTNREGIENRIYDTGNVDTAFNDSFEESQPYEVPCTTDRNGQVSFQNMVSARPGSQGVSTVQKGSATLPVPAYEGMSFDGEDHYSTPFDALRYSELIEQNKEEDIYSNVDPFQKPASDEDEIYYQLRSWGIINLTRDNIEAVGHLGSGQFGSVKQGVWKRQGTRPVDVALKSLTKTSEEDKVKFLQEAAIMAQFRHPNVILLYGVIAKEDPVMLVVELAKQGDLRKYLLLMKENSKEESDKPISDEGVTGGSKESEGVKLTPKTPQMFLKFSQQVALGMQYLAGKGFVHRDLAARNILVTSNNDCKVADFGMSRDLEDESYYVSQGGKIPVKWTAPEAIHYKRYSTASDVWSYGCLLYEIWSVGCKPFEGMRNVEVIELVDSGKRLSPPPGIPKMIYELMTLCWHPETALRPSFRDVVLTLVGSAEMVLNIPEEDSSTNPLAGVLGAPLEAGENMYSQLQLRYLDYAARKETDEDYFEID